MARSEVLAGGLAGDLIELRYASAQCRLSFSLAVADDLPLGGGTQLCACKGFHGHKFGSAPTSRPARAVPPPHDRVQARRRRTVAAAGRLRVAACAPARPQRQPDLRVAQGLPRRSLGRGCVRAIILTDTDALDAPGMLDAPAAAFGRLTIERKGARLTVERRPDTHRPTMVLIAGSALFNANAQPAASLLRAAPCDIRAQRPFAEALLPPPERELCDVSGRVLADTLEHIDEMVVRINLMQ